MQRRAFLQGSVASLAALPFLQTGRTQAFAPGPPQRLVLFPSLNGTRDGVFWPDEGGNLQLITEPLAPILPRVTFIRGLSIAGSANHYAIRSMFTGAPIASYADPEPAIASIDQLVAHALSERHGTTPTPTVHLGARPALHANAAFSGRQNIFRTTAEAVTVEANPVTAHDALWPSQVGTAPSPPAADYQDLTQAVLREELTRLKNRAAGIARAQAKLRLHDRGLPSAAQFSQAASGSVFATCKPHLSRVEALRAALQGSIHTPYTDEYFAPILDAHIDILSHAITCGVTRVATLQSGWADGNVLMPIADGSRLPWHLSSHDNAGGYALIQRAYLERFVRLIQQLEVPDPLDPTGRSMVIDNTCVLWMSECEPNHSANSVSCLYAGSAGGRLKTQTVIHADGATNMHLLASLCQAYGVAQADAAQFGGNALQEVLQP